MWMDVGFYLEVQNLPVRDITITNTSSGTASSSTYSYSPFQPITVKQLMLTSTVQVNIYIQNKIKKSINMHLFVYKEDYLEVFNLLGTSTNHLLY